MRCRLVRLVALTVTILFGVECAAWAQQRVDSLEQVLRSASGAQRVRVLLTLSDELRDLEQGLVYAKEGLALAQKMGEAKLEADALYQVGCYYTALPDDSLALSFYQQSYQKSLSIGYTRGEARALCYMGKTYTYLGDSLASSVHLQRALQRSRSNGFSEQEAEALFEFGRMAIAYDRLREASDYLQQALQLYAQQGKKADQARVLGKLGQVHYMLSEYGVAADFFKQNIVASRTIGDSYGSALACTNLGLTYIKLGSLDLALAQYQTALSIMEAGNDREGIAQAKFGIAQIYESMPRNPLATDENKVNYGKALDFYKQALELYQLLCEEYDDAELRRNIPKLLNNIAIIYSRLATNDFIAIYGEAWEDSLVKLPANKILGAFSLSVSYYNQALALFEQQQMWSDVAGVKANLGTTYSYARDWTQAEVHLTNALHLVRQEGSPYELATTLYALADCRYRQGRYMRAEKLMLESVSIASDAGLKEVEQNGCELLSKLYAVRGNHAEAFLFLQRAERVKDEVYTDKSQKLIAEMQTKYETEKKEQEIKLLSRDKELQDSVIERQRIVIIGAVLGALLILLVALLMFRMYRQKQRANRALEEKNALITSQKKEITDSIRYAGRIQSAVLPSPELLTEALPEHFVLFLPRDIVSGDFFWITRQGAKVVVVAADCTGHGVPGAFMSMLGVSFLYEIVNKEAVMEPAEILNRLRDRVKTTLSQRGKIDEQKDGMDISLCVIDWHQMVMEWAGAYNPLYLIRGGELMEYKANKMPIAIHVNDHVPFTNHRIPLAKGDAFYIFSDGFSDQFGGADMKKFMLKRFKELLLSISHLPMTQQKELLLKAHLEWKGNYEQIDDIIVFGVRV